VILVDTSVWIKHFRSPNESLVSLLSDNQVVIHEFIIGELACGQLKFRSEILGLLQSLPLLPTSSHDEVLYMINKRKLYASGIGWVDSHLVASTLVANNRIWSFDKSLISIAEKLNISF